jgi:hypothetical protein
VIPQRHRARPGLSAIAGLLFAAAVLAAGCDSGASGPRRPTAPPADQPVTQGGAEPGWLDGREGWLPDARQGESIAGAPPVTAPEEAPPAPLADEASGSVVPSPLATCPPPVVVTSSPIFQLVVPYATDAAGNTGSASATGTPPAAGPPSVVVVMPPAPGPGEAARGARAAPRGEQGPPAPWGDDLGVSNTGPSGFQNNGADRRDLETPTVYGNR